MYQNCETRNQPSPPQADSVDKPDPPKADRNLKHSISYSTVCLFALLLFLSNHIVFSQSNKKKYVGTGAVSEFVMPSEAKIVGHFDLFYETKMPNTPEAKRSFWYKMVFNKDCFFKFNLFPLLTSDRYDFRLYRVPNNLNFCYAVSENKVIPLKDIKIKREFLDSAQSKEFRAGLVFTREVSVKKGDAIYIEIVNLWGNDIGHIIDFNTCDYSYVLKATKEGAPIVKADSSLLVGFENELDSNFRDGINNIKNILCPENGQPITLSSISFNQKGVEIVPRYSINGYESKTLPPPKAVVKVPAPVSNLSVNKFNVPAPEVKTSKNEIKRDTLNNALYKPIRIRSKILDSLKGTPVDVPLKIVEEITGKEVTYAKTGKVGEYLFNIDNTKKYKVECLAVGYEPFDKTIDIGEIVKRNNSNIVKITLEPLKAGQSFILRNIQFHANTYIIKAESRNEIERLYKYLKNNPSVQIQISGHTNGNKKITSDKLKAKLGKEWAFEGSSKKLSSMRAEVVKDNLVKKGIESNRIKTKGYGGNKPLIVDAQTQEEMQKNMRVEVLLLKT